MLVSNLDRDTAAQILRTTSTEPGSSSSDGGRSATGGFLR